MKLLSRDEFRTQTLKRFGGRCVIQPCPEKAVDAHHILNRNLFTEPDETGGYFLENGAGLCSDHHLQAERTTISTVTLYDACHITEPAIPHSMSPDLEYDTWGNTVHPDMTRTPGPLFTNEGCQKALRAGHVLWTFPYQEQHN